MSVETSYLEVWAPDGIRRVPLQGDRMTVGRSPDSDVVITHDGTVSSLHAVFQAYPGGWTVRDLASRNGTSIAGERLVGERPLRTGDEVRVGETRIVFRGAARTRVDHTLVASGPPELTRRERDVLLALCRPLSGPGVFRAPASVRDIAASLVVTDAAVKQHLGRLYDKFALGDDRRNRLELANEAFRRGAVSPGDLQPG